MATLDHTQASHSGIVHWALGMLRTVLPIVRPAIKMNGDESAIFDAFTQLINRVGQ